MGDGKEKQGLSDAQLEQRRQAGRGNAGKPKAMAEAEINQRQEAAVLANENKTGPVTEAGKDAVARNAWKTGEHSKATRAMEWQKFGLIGKPCTSTCDKYPCSVVDDGLTQPGEDCMDKTVYVEAFDAIMSSLQTRDEQYGHGMMAAQLAQAVETLQTLRNEIAVNGMVIIKPYVNKAGEVIKDGEKIVGEPMLNPALPQYIKLLDNLGINLPEMMMTPRSVSKLKDLEDGQDAVADLFSRLGRAAPADKPGRTLPGTATRVDE